MQTRSQTVRLRLTVQVDAASKVLVGVQLPRENTLRLRPRAELKQAIDEIVDDVAQKLAAEMKAEAAPQGGAA